MIYLAYGSNLHIEHMQQRCPTAEVLGTSTLLGYRLVFNGVATIEPDPDRSVPVLLWDIKPADEIPLDRYEGYPQLYRRETVQVELNGKTGRCDGLHHEQQRHRTAQPLLLRCDPQGLRNDRAGHRSSGTGTAGIHHRPLNAHRRTTFARVGLCRVLSDSYPVSVSAPHGAFYGDP